VDEALLVLHVEANAPAAAAGISERLVVLPCADSISSSKIHASRFAALRTAPGLTLLAVALPSTLLFRAQSENPDAILITSGEAFVDAVRHRGGFEEIFSETPTVLLAAEPGAAMVRSAARMKIYSVLPMEITTAQVVAAISATVAGFAVTLPRLPAGREESIPGSEHLTAREVEVLRLMARGHRNKQLAALLKISEHTAKFHVSSVMAKLGARTRTEAVTVGVMRGLVAI
jgi:DNA-binding NarL/FixJ family response regulator